MGELQKAAKGLVSAFGREIRTKERELKELSAQYEQLKRLAGIPNGAPARRVRTSKPGRPIKTKHPYKNTSGEDWNAVLGKLPNRFHFDDLAKASSVKDKRSLGLTIGRWKRWKQIRMRGGKWYSKASQSAAAN